MQRTEIDTYIDSMKDEMLEDVKTLVRIDSEKGDAAGDKPFGEGPAKALKAASGMMKKYGLRITNYDNYVVAGDFGPADKELDILAHLDVVPVSKDWTVTQPFEPLIRDGKIYGRGTSDDKGPAVAALYAIRAIHDLHIPLKKGVRLILGSDEECGSADLEYYYSKEKEAPCTFSPDANWPVINIEKARLALPFHAEFNLKETENKEKAGADIVSITAGTKVNVVPGSASAQVAGISFEDLQKYAQKAAETTKAVYTLSEGCEPAANDQPAANNQPAANGQPEANNQPEDNNQPAANNQPEANDQPAANGQPGIKSASAVWKIDVKGQTAHASTPEKGNNALTALLTLLSCLPLKDTRANKTIRGISQLFAHGVTDGSSQGIAMSDEKSGSVTITLNMLSFDGHTLTGAYDCRAPLCATDENLTEVLREHLRENGLTMDKGKMTPAHHVPADTPFVKTLLETYEEYTGKPGRALYTGGGTYVHELKRGVAFGCESEDVDNHMHGDDEFMVVDMITLSAKIFAAAILKICG